MVLTEKEKMVIEDLKTQEQHCANKYKSYATKAKDPVLKDLFETLKEKEQQHVQTLDDVLNGSVSSCDCNDSDGANYDPKATYTAADNSEDKKQDCFLATDCIGSEKLASSEYNCNVFSFGNSKLRKLLADIQIEEQNHAEMLWKYKTANAMA